jgi:CxxC motif-containing protein (DUF1111 family)
MKVPTSRARFRTAANTGGRSNGWPSSGTETCRFNNVGCGTCHTPTYRTAPAGTLINGGKFTVPATLGDKIIHPYSDFMLHDVGTGDGIPVQPTPESSLEAFLNSL